MDRRTLGTLIVAAGLLAGGLCVWACFNHEPDTQTLSFSTNPEDDSDVNASSLSYYMQYTGERADSVHWSFGDGTEADGFGVFKQYDEPGSYYVLCRASNSNGDRYSAYSLTIEPEEYGFLSGYGTEVFLLILSAGLFAVGCGIREED